LRGLSSCHRSPTCGGRLAFVVRDPCDEGVVRSGRNGDAPCERAVRVWVLVATILGSSMVFIEGTVINVALPALQRALGATVVDIQWVVNAYTLFLAALILLGGTLGDRFGRRRVFMTGVAIFTIASILCGLAQSTLQLIIARGVQGIGGALLTPGSLAIISASFPEEERGKAIGLWSAFSALTTAVGPVLGGWLIDTLSWRWVFFINVPFALVVLAVSARRVPESRDENAGNLDLPGAITATAGLAALTWGLLESSERGYTDIPVILAAAVGLALLALFVMLEARAASPMMPLRMLRSRTFAGANILTFCLYAALSASLFFFPLDLIQVHGYSATAAGAALLPFIVLMTMLSRWSGGLVARYGARKPLIIGPLVTAAGFALFIPPGTSGSYWTTFFPAVLVMGLGMAFSVAPLTTTVMNAVPDRQAGTASGINNAVSRVAGLFAIAIAGILMVVVFSDALGTALAEADLPANLRDTIMAQRSSLAAIAIPEDVAADVAERARAAIGTAFVHGFRAVMILATALAAASALVAWLCISPVDVED
jgi:EmrB/QacA subfamily drug resistance transporter